MAFLFIKIDDNITIYSASLKTHHAHPALLWLLLQPITLDVAPLHVETLLCVAATNVIALTQTTPIDHLSSPNTRTPTALHLTMHHAMFDSLHQHRNAYIMHLNYSAARDAVYAPTSTYQKSHSDYSIYLMQNASILTRNQ